MTTIGNLELLIVILFLIVFTVFLELKSYFERKSLLDRIMAKSYEEYATQETYKEELKAKVKIDHKDNEYVNL